MNSVEQAIRAALAKGDVSDSGFRRRIFASASSALERSLVARAYSEAESEARRQTLLSTIRHIESEFIVAVESPTVEGLTPEITVSSPRASVSNDQRTADVLDQLADRPKPSPLQTSLQARARGEKQASKPLKIPASQTARPWLKYAMNIGVLLGLILVGFWAFAEGKRIYINAKSPTPNTEKPVLAENAGATAADKIDWVNIFTAKDTDLLSAAAGAKAEITSRDGVNYVVISGDDANEVSVKIGSGLVQAFAGKRVLFNISARSMDGATLETGAHCDFGAETKCERKRFKITPLGAEYMFAVTVSNLARGEGALLIAPDLTGKGGSVEIESIRATIVEPDAG